MIDLDKYVLTFKSHLQRKVLYVIDKGLLFCTAGAQVQENNLMGNLISVEGVLEMNKIAPLSLISRNEMVSRRSDNLPPHINLKNCLEQNILL